MSVFFYSSIFSPVFLSSGVTVAVLNMSGITQENRDVFTIFIIEETRTSRHSLTSHVGIGSR